MNEIKTTTIRIPSDTLIKIKSMAVKKGTTQNNIINDLINKGLKNTEKGKIKARKINHELPFYNPDKKLNSMGLIGIVEVDDAENIDVQELKDSIHFKKELY